MADFFNKNIKKATARTKEKFLEGIGKSKATQDEAFDFHAANMQKQAKACERLHKELKVYSETLKKLTEAEKNLRESIRQVYEPEWPDREHVVSLTNTLDSQAEELEKKVSEELLPSVTQYVGQFVELKKKVDKRGRKLVDYDSAKNNFNSLKASSKKGDADPKLTKAFTELQTAEGLYKEMNNELLEVLPATYDSRITFLVDTLQTLFNSQSSHQTECAKLHKQLVTQLDVLGTSMDSLRVARPEALATTPVRMDSPTRELNTPQPSPNPSQPPQPSPAPSATSDVAPTPSKRTSVASPPPAEENCEAKLYPKLAATPTINEEQKTELKEEKKEEKKSLNPFEDDDDDVDAEKIDLAEVDGDGRKVLYTVKATHDYKAVDTDELSFATGEIITVLESKPVDNLDDGWQLGRKQDGTVGVFPENFTKKE